MDINEIFHHSIENISSRNTVHDYSQFESTFDYDLQLNGNLDKHYEVDMYFFIPKNLGIDSDSYRREDFYTNLTNYLRVSNPVGRNHLKSATWSLPFLDQYIASHLITQKREKLIEAVIQETKFFGFAFNNKLKDIYHTVRFLHKKPQEFSNNLALVSLLKKLFVEVETILHNYRERYAHYAKEQSIFLDEDVCEVLLLINEYCSYRLETSLIKIYQVLKSHQEYFGMLAVLDNILRKETEYREQLKLINIDNSDDATREYYYYRMGLLKKYVSSVLFLEINNIKKEKKYRNIIAATGAAFAAVWASVSNVQYWQLASSGQQVNFQLFTIIIIGIIAYIFKDRIKEWTKDYFNEQLKHRLPDFDRQMFYTQCNKEGEPKRYFLGTSTEFMRYLKKNSIPEDVAYIREMGKTTELEPEKIETIIHYFKKIKFNMEIIRKLENIDSIKNLMRLDVTKFLTKLDNPEKSLHYFDRKYGATSIEAPKVYHINIVFRYGTHIHKSHNHKIHNVEFERIRLIINKKGIIRVEEVVAKGEMNYSEEKK